MSEVGFIIWDTETNQPWVKRNWCGKPKSVVMYRREAVAKSYIDGDNLIVVPVHVDVNTLMDKVFLG